MYSSEELTSEAELPYAQIFNVIEMWNVERGLVLSPLWDRDSYLLQAKRYLRRRRAGDSFRVEECESAKCVTPGSLKRSSCLPSLPAVPLSGCRGPKAFASALENMALSGGPYAPIPPKP
jgi:hypothetical protein